MATIRWHAGEMLKNRNPRVYTMMQVHVWLWWKAWAKGRRRPASTFRANNKKVEKTA